MSEFGPTPILVDPEVKEAENKGELLEPREAERLAFGFKVATEELHVIADSVGENVKYSDLVQSGYFSDFQKNEDLYLRIQEGLINSQQEGVGFEDSLPETVRVKLLQEYLSEVPEDQRSAAEKSFNLHFLLTKAELLDDPNKIQINLEDLILLWQENPKELFRMIWKGIESNQNKMIQLVEQEGADKNNGQGDEKNSEAIDLIKAQTLGKSYKLGCLLKSHFSQLISKISGMSNEQLEAVQSYGRASSKEVRGAVHEIDQLKRGILAANVGKSPETVRDPKEVSSIYGVEDAEIGELNGWIEEFYKDSFNEGITLGVETIYNEHQDAVDKDFLTSYVNYRQELRSLYTLLNRGKIVETDYVREIIERALPELQKNPPTIVYFHGDFGTGKTALAIHIARTRMKKEPIIVSGSKFLDPDRFTEEFRIRKLPIREFLTKMYKEIGQEKIVDENTSFAEVITDMVSSKDEMRSSVKERLAEKYDGVDKIPSEEIEDIEDQIDSLYSNQVQGGYVIGAMYEAMYKGVPLIIDEANAISPDVLIAFNDLLTKKIGSKIHSRTDKETFEIKEGYCIMWTGNTGERYKNARFNNSDPAAFSRIAPIEVRYLPNSNTYNSIESDIARLNLDKISDITFDGTDVETYVKENRSDATADQIFQVLAVKLLNRRLGAELMVRSDDRYSVFKDLYRLSVGARMIMDLFEGNIDPATFPSLGVAGIVGSDEAATLKQTLQKANLSMRELMDNIVGGYIDGGCNMDIEYYLWNFVKKFDGEPQEQAIIYAILRQAQFFRGDGWPEYADVSGDDAISKFKDIMSINPVNTVDKYKKIRKNGEFTTLLNTQGEYTLQYFSSIETLQLVFGYLPPLKKEEYEKIGQKISESRTLNLENEEKMRLLDQIREVIPKIANIENYKTSEDCSKVIAQIRELPITVEEKRNAMDDAEFLKGVNEFYDTLIRFAEGSGMIDSETAAAALSGSLDVKSQLINTIFKGKE